MFHNVFVWLVVMVAMPTSFRFKSRQFVAMLLFLMLETWWYSIATTGFATDEAGVYIAWLQRSKVLYVNLSRYKKRNSVQFKKSHSTRYSV